jgi:hypothetical protein
MYAEHEDPKLVRILTFDVVLRSGPAPAVYHPPDWSNFAAWKAEYDLDKAELAAAELAAGVGAV